MTKKIIAAAMLAAACLAAAAPLHAQKTIETHRQYRATRVHKALQIEGGKLPGLPAGELPAIHQMPSMGALELSGLVATYTPPLGFQGNDSFTLANGHRRWVVEVRVLPQILPIAGRFRGSEQSPALYDNGTRAFLLCSPPLELSTEPLDCEWRQVLDPTVKAPLIPLAWPGADEISDRPALFDLESGELTILTETAFGLETLDKTVLPGSQGGWPIFGDWDGTGTRRLAIVFADGRVMSRRSDIKWQLWPGQLAVPAPHLLTWPVLLPVAGTRSAVALVDPYQRGSLMWMALAGEETVSGMLGQASIGDLSRPVSWEMSLSPELEKAPHLYFLRKTSEGGLGLFLANRSIHDPSTIPVKFPDDPPGP